MKISKPSSLVVNQSGSFQTSSFGIAHSSHMFNILASGLYSNKIRAIIREVGCNAMDAHLSIGKGDIPFEVKLPSKLDPTFYIKDFGPGLNDEEIQHIYTVYGVSTKENCLEQTGGFGLGSKTPFAYTLSNTENPDGFIITSAKEGVQRTYIAYLNEEGFPFVALMNTQPSKPEWPSGLKVQFLVQASDFEQFRKESQSVFSCFELSPVTPEGVPLVETPPAKELLQVDNISILNSRASDTARIVMANVAYPINREIVNDYIVNKWNGVPSHLLQPLNFSCMTLKVPNGYVQMTPSRESLQYTPEVLATICKMLESILAELKKVAKSCVENVNSYSSTYERILALRPFTQLCSIVFGYMAAAPQSVMFNYLGIPDEFHELLTLQALPVPKILGSESSSTKAWYFDHQIVQPSRRQIKDGQKVSSSYSREVFYKSHPQTLIVYDEPDVTNKLARFKAKGDKIHELLKSESNEVSGYAKGYFLFYIENLPSENPEAAKHLAQFLTGPGGPMEGVAIVGISELADIKKQVSVSTQKASPRIRSRQEVRVWNVKTKSISVQQVSSLSPEDTCYVWNKENSASVVELTPTGRFFQHQIRGTGLAKFITLLNAINSFRETPISNVILMSGTSLSRVAPLTAQGFEPLFSSNLKKALSKWDEIIGSNPSRVAPIYTLSYSAKPNLAVFSLLVYLAGNDNLALSWKELNRLLPSSNILKDILSYSQYNKEIKPSGYTTYDTTESAILAAEIQTILPDFTYSQFHTEASLNARWLEQYPTLAVINPNLDKLLTTDKSTLTETQLAILKGIAQLISTVEAQIKNPSFSAFDLILLSTDSNQLISKFDANLGFSK